MDNKNLKSILEEALEEQIPASHVNLLPNVQARLVARKQSSLQQGENMNKTRNRKLALSAMTIVALLTVVLITPQGRAFAQSVLHLFTRAESDSFSLPTEQIMPTRAIQANSTALPPGSLLSVADAERSVGFDVLELPAELKGFKYLGARLYGNTISIEYEAQGGGGNLVITQSRDGYTQSDWAEVPADAIIPVKIGSLDGEYAQGMFVVYGGETSATWNADAPVFRLRWVSNSVWFEMAKFGDVGPIEYLDQTGLIELAESMR